MDSACALRGHNTLNESIAESLMIPFKMVMLHVLGEHPSEMALAKWDHAMQTLFFDGAHEPLRRGIRIRRLKRGLRDTDARVTQETPDLPAPFPVAVTDQHAMIAKHAIISSREHSTDLPHEQLAGMRRGSDDLDAA